MGHLYMATVSLPVRSPPMNQNIQSYNVTVTVAAVKSTATVIKGTFGGVAVEMMLDSVPQFHWHSALCYNMLKM